MIRKLDLLLHPFGAITVAAGRHDAGANPILLHRMDRAWIASSRLALDKAFTARAFDRATADLKKFTQSGERVLGLHSTHDGRVIIFGGGLPLSSGGEVVEGVGVSGAHADQDVAIAEAGAAALVAALGG